ncbi:hypothetical protein P2318_17665 [Myxococcaceae bacterium GXIMD 01537]
MRSGPEWLSGGPYGVEASVVTLAVWTAASVFLLMLARRRGQFFLRGRTVAASPIVPSAI